MGAFFTPGEQKARPGAFIRVSSAVTAGAAELPAGVCAAVFKADWGPLGVAVEIDSDSEREVKYGAASATSGADLVTQELAAAKKVVAVRVGTGGTKASKTLQDTTGTPVNVITCTAKYAGTRALTVTIRDSAADATKREFIVYEGTRVRQIITFTKGTGEIDSLIAAWTAAGSDWVDLAKLAAGNGVMAAITQSSLTGGANPTITNGDYTTALSVIESANWDVVACDSTDNSVHVLLSAYLARVYSDGKMVRGVVAETTSIAIATRMTNAAAFNSYLMHYVLNPYNNAAGTKVDGYQLAGRIAGMIAAAPANASLTHQAISGAATLAETLTNAQIEAAIAKGCLVLSYNAAGAVMIEYGINTLVTLASDQDAGWKKIRRTSTRFELLKRATAVADPLIGTVDNSADGRATICAAIQGIINAMIGEGKLLAGGSCVVDPDNPPAGDSAWFKIAVDDLDSAEKLYFAFGFRFAPV